MLSLIPSAEILYSWDFTWFYFKSKSYKSEPENQHEILTMLLVHVKHMETMLHRKPTVTNHRLQGAEMKINLATLSWFTQFVTPLHSKCCHLHSNVLVQFHFTQVRSEQLFQNIYLVLGYFSIWNHFAKNKRVQTLASKCSNFSHK